MIGLTEIIVPSSPVDHLGIALIHEPVRVTELPKQTEALACKVGGARTVKSAI